MNPLNKAIVNSKKRHKSSQSGFTLLEVMVALFIFAVTGTAILKTTAEHLNSLGKLEEITFATWIANNRLTQVSVEAQRTWPPKKTQKGEAEMVDRVWYWQQEVIDTPESDLKEIVISVGLDPDFEDEITSVSTYLAKPAST